jgi:hypothetical protein
MERRPPVALTPDLAAGRARAREETESPRDIEDVAQLQELLKFGQGLAAWVEQFEVASPATLLAAGAVGHRGIDRLLQFIEDMLLRLAPYTDDNKGRRDAADARGAVPASDPGPEKSVAGGAVAREWAEAKRQLTKTLNYALYLCESVAGHLRQEPDLKYPYDESPDDLPWWDWTWEPADDETVAAAEIGFRRVRQHQLVQKALADAQRVHDKIAELGRRELLHLVQQLESDSCDEGFPHIRTLVDAMPTGLKKTRARAVLRKFERRVASLREVISDPVPGDPAPYGKPYQEFFATNLTERFVGAGRAYIEVCLPLLTKVRGSLQGRRKKVARWIAIVAQYAFMASGNGLFGRFAGLVAAVDVLASNLQEDVAALLDSASAKLRADEDELQSIVNQMNTIVVEPKVLTRWRAGLDRAGAKKDATYYGSVIGTIVDSEGKQTKPWSRGDVLPALRRAGLITAEASRKKLDAITDACCLMQQVGLAVQLPLDHLLKAGDPPPKRKGNAVDLVAHDGLPWIVNPLGAALIQLGSAVTKKKPRGRRPGKRRQTKTVSSTPTPRSTTRKVTRQKRRAAKKPRKLEPPRERSIPKAAKKWPRA